MASLIWVGQHTAGSIDTREYDTQMIPVTGCDVNQMRHDLHKPPSML